MEIHHGVLSDVCHYLELTRHLRLEDKLPDYERYLRHVRRYKQIDASSAILEIGTGTGWFPLCCKWKGLNCKGLEISSQLIEYAHELGGRYGIVPDIELGNIETSDLGSSRYDVIIAMSVFEHVENWREGLRKIYEALRPGGLFLFESTNKFALGSGEYPSFPLYGWMPNSWRYRFRIARDGPDIMRLGIDFHQFTYGGLKRALRQVGYREIYDRIDLTDPDYVRRGWRQRGYRLAQKFRPFGNLMQTFLPTTNFVCIK